MKGKEIAIILLMSILFTGCSLNGNSKYENAVKNYENGEYLVALRLFKEDIKHEGSADYIKKIENKLDNRRLEILDIYYDCDNKYDDKAAYDILSNKNKKEITFEEFKDRRKINQDVMRLKSYEITSTEDKDTFKLNKIKYKCQYKNVHF